MRQATLTPEKFQDAVQQYAGETWLLLGVFVDLVPNLVQSEG